MLDFRDVYFQWHKKYYFINQHYLRSLSSTSILPYYFYYFYYFNQSSYTLMNLELHIIMVQLWTTKRYLFGDFEASLSLGYTWTHMLKMTYRSIFNRICVSSDLKALFSGLKSLSKEKLLHDFCKKNFYKKMSFKTLKTLRACLIFPRNSL